MKLYRYTRYMFLISALCIAALAGNARPTVKASLDSATLLMGEMTNLRVTVEQDNNTRGRFTILEQLSENGIIPLCGDSVELRAPSKIDTVRSERGLTINAVFPVQSFDSGYYRLPEIEFVVGVDTSRSNSVSLKVVPVPNLTADTPIDDYANVAEPENKSIFDAVPDWMVKYWWVILIILLALAGAVYMYIRYRKEGHILPKKPEPTPYEVAVRDLESLKGKKLWEQGMEKEYFTDLTDILRKYLFGRFGINATEMTSRQILSAISANKDIRDKRQMIRQILDMADFVKFAKVRPLPADNIASYDNAIRFVHETKPVPVAENGNEDGKDTSDKNKEAITTSGNTDATNTSGTATDNKKGGKA